MKTVKGINWKVKIYCSKIEYNFLYSIQNAGFSSNFPMKDKDKGVDEQ